MLYRNIDRIGGQDGGPAMATRSVLKRAWEQTLGQDPAFARSANAALPKRAAVPGGLEPFTGTWNRTQAKHLLRRTLFGCTRAQIDWAVETGLSEVVATLLAEPLQAPSPPVAVSDQDTGVPIGQTWVTAAYDGNLNFIRGISLQSWWMGLITSQGNSLLEKMTLFWHNHFANELAIVSDARYMYAQNEMLRRSAFGNVKDLVKAMSVDCAMLRYLNGDTNTAKNPNENYARELQELFTIGKGPEISAGNYTHYTEDDVKAAARVLTGFNDVRDTMRAEFIAKNHDATDKVFSSAYGNAVIKGRSGEDGAKELDDLVDLIFAQAETARYLCRKLYRYFVYYVIDAETEKNVIVPMADLLRQGQYEIKPVLSALLQSAHFHHALNQGCMIKTPIDIVAGFTLQFEATFPDKADPVPLYTVLKSLNGQAEAMQMELLNPPNVAGWPAYYQDPLFYELWINSDTLPKRVRFTDQFLNALKWTSSSIAITLNLVALAEKTSDPGDVNALIGDLADTFLALALTEKQLTYLKESLLGGLPDFEWTDDWETYVADKAVAASRKAVETRLKSLFRAMVAMAEFQLC
jgi:uncharacterized protein (DUF1800 family)